MKNSFIIGKKIYLRPIVKKDLNENYKNWFNDADVCMFNSHHRFPNYNEDMLYYYKKVIKTRNNLILAIIDKKTDSHVGNISLQNINYIDKAAELAVIIGDKKFWGKGIGKEAGNLILKHGFNDLNLHRISCGTSKENKGMQGLAGSLGFKREGVLREALYKNGRYNDIINYGLLKKEYEKKGFGR
ncbi:MAG: GNAT family protein [Patescibacteria group bacterium]